MISLLLYSLAQKRLNGKSTPVMAGIEIAGLILGAIPLVISGLEHYSDGISTLGRYRRYKAELKILVNVLATEEARLLNICEKLLVGVVPPWKIEGMIKHPLDDLWKDDEIQQKIRFRLWRSYAVFEKTAKDVHDAIREMETRVGLQPDGKIMWLQGNRLLRELNRAKFSLMKSSYDDLIARITDGIGRLETLTSQNVELEPQRTIRSQYRFLTLLTETVQSLYRALQKSLACHPAHDVNLELAARTSKFTPDDEDETITKSSLFRIAILTYSSSGPDSQDLQKAQSWCEVVIKERGCSIALAPSTEPFDSRTRSRKGKKTVRFSNSPPIILPENINTPGVIQGQSTSTTLVQEMSHLSLVPTKLNAVLDLCEALRKSSKQPSQECCGYIMDIHSSKHREYGLYPCMEEIEHEVESTLSLRKVIDGPPEGLPPLTYSDRLYLAAVISSSVLQLHKTPWLPEKLTSDDIFFPRREDGHLYRHPYVFRRVPEPNPPAAVSTTVKLDHLPYNPTVLSLGILLVELILGKSLRAAASAYTSVPDILTNYAAAQQLQSEVDQYGGPNYGSAVRRCLNFSSYRQPLSLGDEGFRHEVYAGVVAPLEETLANDSVMF
ncbi:hypothetical protein F5X98DRAFT_351702 [Xylaria grammica]|nr:hypothetical protein F5X98DRAFT_351702 [Xylaria grammica]